MFLVATIALLPSPVEVASAGAMVKSPSRSTSAPLVAHSTSATSQFCSRLPIARIDSIVGASVSLADALAEGKVLACIYTGIPGNMSIETQTGIPLPSTSTLSAAEAGARKEFPSGQRVTFAAVPSIGPVAFSWTTHKGTVVYSGLNTYKGSMGYFVEMGGRLKLSPLEKLVKLAISAATPSTK
jgi:hypothetical protein